MRETFLVKAIMDYLKMRTDVRLWRQNTGAVKYDDNRYVHFGFPGIADIIGIQKGGRFVAIEAKIGKNKQSDAQKAFQAMIEGMGGLYILAYCIDDVIKGLE